MIPRPFFCLNAGVNGIPLARCTHDVRTLTPTILPASSRILCAQLAVDQAIEGTPPTALGIRCLPFDYLRRLRILVSLILRFGQLADLGALPPSAAERFEHHVAERRAIGRAGAPADAPEPGYERSSYYNTTPTEPLLLAATAPLAVEMLAADDPSSLADTVSWAQLVARAVASPLVVYEPVEVVFRGCRGARAVGERGATAAGPGDS
jgi:hypothetical protein